MAPKSAPEKANASAPALEADDLANLLTQRPGRTNICAVTQRALVVARGKASAPPRTMLPAVPVETRRPVASTLADADPQHRPQDRGMRSPRQERANGT